MTVAGFILSSFLIVALIGFLIQAAGYVFDIDEWQDLQHKPKR
jgi:hypothetical protein